MKKIFTLLIGIAFSITILNSQIAPPRNFSYKATITKTLPSGTIVPLMNKTIGLKIVILQGDPGSEVYSEISFPTTNSSGQIDIVIGGTAGLPIIDWANYTHSLQVWVDSNGDEDFVMPMSTTQLLSVPYALYAGSAGSAVDESDPDFNASAAVGITDDDIYNWDHTMWSEIEDKPTTITGYGITDAFDGTWGSLTGTPTTAYGYGINDVVTLTGNQDIAGNKTFTGIIKGKVDADYKVVSNVAYPSANQDAATKAYVDSHIEHMISNYERIYVEDPAGCVELNPGSTHVFWATCPTGKLPIGGGGGFISMSGQITVNDSFPLTDGWAVNLKNVGTYAGCGHVFISILCATCK